MQKNKLFTIFVVLFILIVTTAHGKKLKKKVKYVEDPAPIVIDFDGSNIIAGFGRQQSPSVIIPAIIGTPLDPDFISDPEFPGYFVGNEADSMRDQLYIQEAFAYGIVKDWDVLTKVLDHLFKVELNVDPSKHAVMICENLFTFNEVTPRLGAILFDTFSVPAIQVASQPVLNMLFTGHYSGISIEFVYDGFYITAVKNAVKNPYSIIKIPLGEGIVVDFMIKLLIERGLYLTTVAEREMVNDMVEKFAYVAYDYEEELNAYANGTSKGLEYTMLNGRKVKIGIERFKTPEVLFKPSLFGKEYAGIHKQLLLSISKCDETDKSDYYSNIVITGKFATVPGLTERLKKEMKKLAPSVSSINVVAIPENVYPTWTGGSTIIGVIDNLDAWIPRDLYNQEGTVIINRMRIA